MRDLAPLVYWVKEREAIRIKKDRGDPFPWTEDEILRTYRFCNVRREDDRVTKWIATNIREQYRGERFLWLMLCIARQINWPDTLSALMHGHIGNDGRAWPNDPEFCPRELADALNRLAESGAKVFTGAYIITAPPTKGEKKTDYVAHVTLGELWIDHVKFERHFANTPTLRSTHQLLMKYSGWGPFLAYQAVVDMRFTDILGGAPDVGSFIAAGPGTIRGLNRLNGRRLEYPLPQGEAMYECREIYKTIQADTGVEMDLSDVPNILCETDKFLRVKNGEGKPRALYVPGRGA